MAQVEPEEEAENAETLRERTWTVMPECVWMQEGICVNEDCPMFCGSCPVEDEPGVCWYEEREEVQGDG